LVVAEAVVVLVIALVLSLGARGRAASIAELRVSASLDLILIWRAVLLASDDVMLLCRAMRDDSCDTLRRIQTLKMIERIGARKNLLSRTSAQAGIADLAGSPAELALGRMSSNERNLRRPPAVSVCDSAWAGCLPTRLGHWQTLPDSVGIIAAIRHQHCLWAQFAQENRAKLIVMRLAGREANLYRQAIGIHDGMNFGRQPATRAAHVLLIIASDAGSVLMHSHDGRIDHLHRRIMHCSQCIHDLVPDASPSPANKVV
jgi:hypothetical protein